MTTFGEKFGEIWEYESGESLLHYDRNDLNGIYHLGARGRAEIRWRPNHPTCRQELIARTVFKLAIYSNVQMQNSLPWNEAFQPADPLFGDVALKVRGNQKSLFFELAEVALLYPYIGENAQHELIG